MLLISAVFYAAIHRISPLLCRFVRVLSGAACATGHCVGVGDIRWAHSGDRVRGRQVANDRRHVQSVPAARVVHHDLRHCVPHAGLSKSAAVHRAAGCVSVPIMVCMYENRPSNKSATTTLMSGNEVNHFTVNIGYQK